MEHSGAAGISRKAPPRSSTPELFDLRTSFAVERRLLPGLLLLAVLTGFAAMGAGADALALGWLALAALNAAARFLVATTHVDAKYIVVPESTGVGCTSGRRWPTWHCGRRCSCSFRSRPCSSPARAPLRPSVPS